MPKPTTVEQYIQQHPQWEEKMNQIKDILDESELQPAIKWGAPVYTLKNKNLVGMVGFKDHLGIWFFQGALIDDRYGVLENAQEGKTKALRHLKLKATEDVPTKILEEYIQQTVDLQKAGKEIKPKKNTKKVVIPEELTDALKKDSTAKKGFEGLTLSRKREYAEHISSAKQDATKQRRLKKILPMIAEGKGLNDKYR